MVRAEETQGQSQLSTYLPVDNLNFAHLYCTHDKVSDGKTQELTQQEFLFSRDLKKHASLQFILISTVVCGCSLHSSFEAAR